MRARLCVCRRSASTSASTLSRLCLLIPVLHVSRPLAISFLACNKNPDRFREDASFLYRCDNLACALADLGHDVVCDHVSRFRWRHPLDVVVFHRPMLSPTLWLLIGRLRRRGVRVVMDVDDLVFDPAAAGLSPAVLNGRADLKGIVRRFKRHRQALLRADVITVSTEPLQQELAHLTEPPGQIRVVRIPNAVHHSWRELALPEQRSPAPVLRYLPGTRSHDRDFAQITEALVAVLRPRPAVRLEIVGPLTCELPLPAEQWCCLPKLPFSRYHAVVASSTVNLAPLERSRFTWAKSAIKVIEASFWGVPTLCSPFPDALRLQGAGALICDSPQDWATTLAGLLDTAGQQGATRPALRQAILAHADVRRWALNWVEQVAAPSSADLRSAGLFS